MTEHLAWAKARVWQETGYYEQGEAAWWRVVHAGTEEGGFAWLTLNYLLGHLGHKESDTVAAIDLVSLWERQLQTLEFRFPDI